MNRYKEEKEKDYMGLYVAEAAHFVKQIYRPCHYLEEIRNRGPFVAL